MVHTFKTVFVSSEKARVKKAHVIFWNCLLIMGLTVVLQAQNTKPVPTQNLLPDINPQDIEIRGVFKASFPGIRRQPILGFNPKPRVYRIDPNRLPFMEDDRAAAVQLPVQALSQSVRQPSLPPRSENRQNGYAKLGGANFLTGFTEAAYRSQLSKKTELDLFGYFLATDGHLAEPIRSDFNQKDFQLSLGHNLSTARKLRFVANYNGGYNYQPISSLFNSQARKDVHNYSVSLNHQAIFNPVSHSNVALAFNQLDVSLGNELASRSVIENALDFNFTLAKAANTPEQTYGLKVGAQLASYDGDFSSDALNHNWMNLRAQLSSKKRLNDQSTLLIEAGAVYFQDYLTDNGILPVLGLSVKRTLSDGFSIALRTKFDVETTSLRELQRQNPFMGYELNLPNTKHFETGIELRLQPASATQITADFNYNVYRDFAFFTSEVDPATQLNSFGNTVEDEAQIPELSLQVKQYAFGQRMAITAHYLIRQPELGDNGNNELSRIPANIAQTEAWAELSYQWLQKVQVWTRLQQTGERYSRLVQSDAEKDLYLLAAYTLLHFGANYQFAEKMHAGIQLLNILDKQYQHWEGFTERGLELRLEVRMNF